MTDISLRSTAKLLSLAVLISFAFAGSATAQGDTYTLHTDTLDEEKIWGEGTTATDTPLTATVSMDTDYVYFQIETEAVDGDSEETVTVDKQSDGTANYQIQYTDNGVWEIAYTDDGDWSEFETLPSSFDAEINEDSFTVQIPVQELETGGQDFRFGAQVNTEAGQLLYPEGDQLWYNGENYVTSEYYHNARIDYVDLINHETEQLESQLDTLTSELETLEDTLGDEIEVNEENITEAVNRIDELRNDLDNLDETDIDGLDQRFENELNTLDTELRTYVDAEIQSVENQIQQVQDTYLTEEEIENRLEETEEQLREYSDETDTGDTQIGYDGFTDYLKQFWETQANFIKDWVESNFASEERVDTVEDQVQNNMAEIKQLERQVDGLYGELNESEQVDVEREDPVDTAQQVMLENEIEELSVEDSDGRDWNCSLGTHRSGADEVTCVTSD